jgi:hypothetical protein
MAPQSDSAGTKLAVCEKLLVNETKLEKCKLISSTITNTPLRLSYLPVLITFSKIIICGSATSLFSMVTSVIE